MPRRQMGATARVLEKFQNIIQKLVDDIGEEKENRLEIQKQILAEHKQMRIAYENSTSAIEQQLKRANKLREERNALLKDLIAKKNSF